MDALTFHLLNEASAPASAAVRLQADGRIFRRAGEAWRWKGVSAFALLDRFAKGEAITPFFRAFDGYNLLRVWCYTPVKEWGSRAWEMPAPGTVLRFLDLCAAAGFYVELTLLTDDDPARLGPAAALVAFLSAHLPANLLIEVGNEPTTHKEINTGALHALLTRSGLQHASGNGDDGRWYGTYGTHHSARDAEWPRRAHDLMEFYMGDGPETKHEPYRVPWVADEPIRPDQAQGDLERDFFAYAAACSLLGAGATFHFEGGKFAQLPTELEARCAAAFLAGLNVFPPAAPLGVYRRPAEASLRTYVVGDYMVRIRPASPAPPEPGWMPFDAYRIAWHR